jgi:hypothetical protein
MQHQVTERILRYNVFLAAYLAIAALYGGIAVKAVLFFAFCKMRHGWK